MANFLQDEKGDWSLTRLLMAITFCLDWLIIIITIIWQKNIPAGTLDLITNMNYIFGGIGLVKSGAENLKLFKKEEAKDENSNTTAN